MNNYAYGKIFLDKPYVKIIFQYLTIKWSWYTESIQFKFLFSHLESTRNDLVAFK